MGQLTDLAHQFVEEYLHAGDIAIDATCGNGHDVRFLAELVGSAGSVIACDLQQVAIDTTKKKCADCENVQYYLGDHAEILDSLNERYSNQVVAMMFNLGYLPGGDKAKTTSMNSTLRALDSSFQLLKPGGVLSVLAYVGHPGGLEEANAVSEVFQQWSIDERMKPVHSPPADQPVLSPQLYVALKQP